MCDRATHWQRATLWLSELLRCPPRSRQQPNLQQFHTLTADPEINLHHFHTLTTGPAAEACLLLRSNKNKKPKQTRKTKTTSNPQCVHIVERPEQKTRNPSIINARILLRSGEVTPPKKSSSIKACTLSPRNTKPICKAWTLLNSKSMNNNKHNFQSTMRGHC